MRPIRQGAQLINRYGVCLVYFLESYVFYYSSILIQGYHTTTRVSKNLMTVTAYLTHIWDEFNTGIRNTTIPYKVDEN